jgi:hypothetical protein
VESEWRRLQSLGFVGSLTSALGLRRVARPSMRSRYRSRILMHRAQAPVHGGYAWLRHCPLIWRMPHVACTWHRQARVQVVLLWALLQPLPMMMVVLGNPID